MPFGGAVWAVYSTAPTPIMTASAAMGMGVGGKARSGLAGDRPELVDLAQVVARGVR
ncbi:hypothetical protein GCM10010168_49480 [Actinoplanes ianthinogenes]|uniref:Uncharacterized protein n=1 Tax=Actinoplanes ianthinogenes TaxID=122358 RepID=A0ABM7M349_9ACTN|nr:hypothetical protein Aiant_66570 [Actinoplanes ianthinogenes]GGR25596.1 hypothetical protein GCM10010168_49480 [Actinoplanes ianthinogenes]